MEFRVERDSFFECLSNITQVIPTRSPNKVLTNVLLEAKDGKLQVKGTNFDQTMVAVIDIEGIPKTEEIPGGEEALEKEEISKSGEISEGSCGTPARKLYELLRELPGKKLDIKSDTQLRITVEGTENEYSLPLVKAEEFPEIPTTIESEFSFQENTDRFLNMHSKTSFVASQDISMIAYTGILWQIRMEEMRMVSTDGHRLALFVNKQPTEIKQEYDLLIPSQSSSLLSKLLAKSDSETFKVEGNKANLLFRVDNYSLITRLIMEKFPNYEAVMPRDNDKKLTINRDDFIAALRRAEIFCSPLSHLIILEMDEDSTTLITYDEQTGSHSSETLSSQYQGARFKIGFSVRDLIDITRHIETENVVINLKGPLTAAIVEPANQPEQEKYLCLIMPLRIPEE